jgi:hypothetical protein
VVVIALSLCLVVVGAARIGAGGNATDGSRAAGVRYELSARLGGATREHGQDGQAPPAAGGNASGRVILPVDSSTAVRSIADVRYLK